jgi:serine/threonine-protein kinase PknK
MIEGPASAESSLRVLRQLAEKTPRRELLVEAVDGLIAALGAERGFLFRWRAAGGFRVLVARHRDRENLALPGRRMSHHAVSRMMRTGKLLVVADARRDRRYRTEDVLEGRKPSLSIIILPLYVGGELAGGVYLDHRFRRFEARAAQSEAVQRWAALCGISLAVREQAARIRWLEKAAALGRRAPPVQPAPAGGAALDAGEPAVRRQSAASESVELAEFHGLLSANPDMLDLFDTVRSLRHFDLPVLICGETGSGKNLLARAVHLSSSRAARPFITISCGAMPETLLESELFGHVRGAFTGAERDHTGLLLEADGGTLFLDEVGDMGLEVQKKLLRVLEDGKVRPLGGKEVIEIDVRIIASSAHDLDLQLRERRFRADLFFRLKGILLQLPALRERREDIPGLVAHFLARYSPRERMPVVEPEAMERLVRSPWPGNVRELENEIRRLGTLGADRLRAADLSPALRKSGSVVGGDSGVKPLELVVDVAAREAVAQALRRSGGNKSEAARLLGITRKALYRRLARYRIDRLAESRPLERGRGEAPRDPPPAEAPGDAEESA